MHPTSFHSILNPPLRYAGANNKRRAWQEFFDTYTGPVAYGTRGLTVTAEGGLAFVHSLNHVKGTLANGHIADLWVRWTRASGESMTPGSLCTITCQSRQTSSTARLF